MAVLATRARPLGYANVHDFGAVGDGVADDTAAVQAAFNSLTAGGIVFLPPGRFRLTSTVGSNVKGVSVIGSGMGGNDAGGGDEFISTLDGSAITNGVILSSVGNDMGPLYKGFRIQGPGATVAGDISIGINFYYAKNAHVQDVYITQCRYGIKMSNTQGGVLTNCYTRFNATTGLALNAAQFTLVQGCVFSDSNQGTALMPSANIWIFGASAYCHINGPLIDESEGSGSSNAAIWFQDCHNCSVNNSVIYASHNGYGIRVGDGITTPSYVQVSGCYVTPYDPNVDKPVNTIKIEAGATNTSLSNTATSPGNVIGAGDLLDNGTATSYANVNGLDRRPGHISSVGSVPTVVAGANAGTSPPSPVITGSTDTRGKVTFGSGTGPSAGAQAVVAFAAAYAAAPTVTASPLNAATAALQPYISAVGTGGFTVSTVVAPTASQANTTYAVSFVVIG